MSKATQAVVSKKSQYWMPKNRYYELKYFCFQFWDWQKQRSWLDGLATRENREPTEEEAIKRAALSHRIEMVMNAIDDSTKDHPEIYEDLLYGVTKGYSYDAMAAKKVLPLSREAYYNIYRLFFYLLGRARE